MLSTTSLINKLSDDFPQFKFIEANQYRWSFQEKSIYFDIQSNDPASLLHELSHALLNHQNYTKDVTLIEMERSAWDHAQSVLSPSYGVKIKEDTIEDALDSYRDWLHGRSICPQCNATGIQASLNTYKCVTCRQSWRVNEARTCSLKRYSIKKNNPSIEGLF